MAKLISELGLNHNGSFKNLIKLSEMSLQAGYDLIKIQVRTPRLCVPKDQWNKPREWFDGTPMTYIEYKERLELNDEQLSTWMRQYQGQAFASVWDIPSLERIARYNPPYIKVPSAMLTNDQLLNTTIDTGISVILSTGMSTVEEIDHAVGLFPADYNLILMHCTSSYPVADEEINLRAIKTLRDRYMLPVGYSSHDRSPYSSLYALALGAWGVETHATLDRSMKGTDQSSSLEKPGLDLIARERNRLEKIMGDGIKRVYSSEIPIKEKLRG